MLSFLSRRWSVLLLVLLLGTGCSKTPLQGDELEYVGYWQSYNGSTLEILANGGGSCKKLGFDGNISSSQSLSGAQVLVENYPPKIRAAIQTASGVTQEFLKSPVISLKLMGLSMDYHVDAEPAQVNGKMQMTLDGMDYVKMN